MIVLGVVLVVVGFITAMPSGSAPGSIARRNVAVGVHGIYRTPGYQERGQPWSWRKTLLRVAIGIALVAAGVACIAVA